MSTLTSLLRGDVFAWDVDNPRWYYVHGVSELHVHYEQLTACDGMLLRVNLGDPRGIRAPPVPFSTFQKSRLWVPDFTEHEDLHVGDLSEGHRSGFMYGPFGGHSLFLTISCYEGGFDIDYDGYPRYDFSHDLTLAERRLFHAMITEEWL